MTVDSNQFSYDVDIPFLVKAEFINSAPFAIKLSVKHDSGSYIVKDFYVTNSNPFTTDQLVLNGAYIVELEKDGVDEMPWQVSF